MSSKKKKGLWPFWLTTSDVTLDISQQKSIRNLDIDILAIGVHLNYLPQEFNNIILIAVYIPPSENAEAACDTIHTITAGLQSRLSLLQPPRLSSCFFHAPPEKKNYFRPGQGSCMSP